MGHFTRRNFLAAMGGLLATACGRPAAAASDAWVDRRSYGPFQCVAAFPLGPLDGFFRELSRLEHELQRTLGVPPAGDSVDVYLLADENAHRQFLSERFPRVPYRRALYVQRGQHGAVYAYRHEELPIDLRHECTHALLHTNLPTVPLWLDEGLAEYFEMPESKRAYEHPHLSPMQLSLRFGKLQPVESLEARRELGDMGAAEYRYAWAWVHFMLHGPLPVHRALVEYLAEIRRGEDAGQLSDRLRAATSPLEDRMMQHFQYWRES
ncbi:MAG TPA: hypothetical protein VF175_13000 [Lacipirellula sp.]